MEENYKAHILQYSQSRKENILRNKYIEQEPVLAFLHKVTNVLIGDDIFDDIVFEKLNDRTYREVLDFFFSVISFNSLRRKEDFTDPWTIDNPIIKKFVICKGESPSDRPYQINSIVIKLWDDDSVETDDLVKFLKGNGFSIYNIVKTVCRSKPFYKNSARYYNPSNGFTEFKLTKFGAFILPFLKPEKNFFGKKKENEYKKMIDEIILGSNSENADQKLDWLMFLYEHYKDDLEGKYEQFILSNNYRNEAVVNYNCIDYLIEKDASAFDSLVLKIVNQYEKRNEYRVVLYWALNRKLKGRYHAEIVELSENYLISAFQTPPSKYPYDVSLRREGYWSITYSKYLLEKDREQGKERIKRLLNESVFLLYDYFRFVDTEFGEESLPWLVEQLFKDSGRREHFTVLFELISKYDFRIFLNRIEEFLVNHTNAKTRSQTAVFLSKYPDEILPVGERLIGGKIVNQRIAGAQILSVLETERATQILNEAVDGETNDDTRNIMLESLADKRFATPYTLKMVKEMIARADSRKKLSRWSEKWIEEEKLPKLYWGNGKVELSLKEVRFLIYRMKQPKGLNSDMEARQMITYIDKSSSSAFAKAMLVAFQNSNADSKLKYYLSIAGMLGGDEMTYLLNSLFRKSIADKRVKMAEYAIGALAMVGTSKALRSIEVIYRKFANKKPAISAVAKEALTTAATELNISMNELADRIIPDFDFEGLYKHFEVDGDEYRAFVNGDFKLSFINEDNKIRKSVPPNTSKELKSEFKEIEKEIRDVVKSQSGRLEKYMLDERRWTAVHWHDFFFMNPIMFIYAMKLIWGVFDENNHLEQVFYCTEDATLYDLNDDEVTVPSDRFVGILHPAHLDSSNRKLWFDKIFEMQLTTIFPIFERTVFTVSDEEKELSLSKQFFNQDVPKGADFVNTFLVKKNWLKTPGDGARSEFSKLFKDGEIIANANIDGPLVVYLGGNTKATVFEISFASVKDKRHEWIKLKDLPPIFYSEVLYDIDELIKAE